MWLEAMNSRRLIVTSSEAGCTVGYDREKSPQYMVIKRMLRRQRNVYSSSHVYRELVSLHGLIPCRFRLNLFSLACLMTDIEWCFVNPRAQPPIALPLC